MSQTPATGPNPAPTPPPPPTVSTKRQTQLSGYSLLARGEPQIWFTGGMLVVCLVMIVGLMSYILWAGLPTFWPRPVQWLVLTDGSLEIGQFQATEPEEPLEESLEDSVELPTEETPTAAINLPSSPSVTSAQRFNRYYRTGNFDLTGQHYRWLSASELNEAGIFHPSWAMVVERLENGRLYGLLGQLWITADIGTAARQELARYQQLRGTLAAIPDMPPELLTSVTAAIEQQQTIRRDQALRAALSSDPSAKGLPQVQNADGLSWKSVSDAPMGAPFVAARRLFTDEAEVYQQLQIQIEHATALRSRVEDVRYQISRRDARLSELRAQVRRAELASGTQIATPVESSHFLLEQYAALSERRRDNEVNRQLLEQLGTGQLGTGQLGTGQLSSGQLGLGQPAATQPWKSAVLKLFNEYAITGLPAELQVLAEQLEAWLAPIAEQNPALLVAVEQYHAGYLQIIDDKRPLQREVAELEEQLALATATFLVPFAPSTLAAQSSEIEQLLAGNISPAVQQLLAAQSIEVQPDKLLITKFSDRLTLAFTLDQSNQRQVIAIVRRSDFPAAEASVAIADGPNNVSQLLLLQSKSVGCDEMVRALATNQLGWWGKVSVYVDRWREFLLENPREANTEGGVFPAIWGTVVMTLIMTIAVVPFGVMAALYLREYTKSGPLVSIIRISINNLAGVPSIVYGVFGFSFFCYTIGAFIDGGARNAEIQPWPPALWFIALGAVSVIGTIAFFLSFTSGGPSHSQTGFKRIAARLALVLWLISVAVLGVLILKSPFFEGFYREYLPNPTFGKGGLLWAAMTLSLLTLPVVIVATEEALAAVPNSLREGSLACGASKWQTIYRIVLPHARPGILTGAILAMARGAGEVAPLMLVGALASAPDLPLDSEFPFFHGSRSFMHLGYQIYTLGFQSQNSEAAKPMVFTCTLLLITIVAVLNISAIFIRSRLKRQFQGNQF